MNEAAYAHYGIDPKAYDNFYRVGDASWCRVCGCHYAANSVPRCDLELARAGDIEAEGFDVKFCPHCRSAYPSVISRRGLCPSCRRAQDLINAQVRREIEYRKRGGAGAYISDGLGCVEKVPAWMVDWDGGPGR